MHENQTSTPADVTMRVPRPMPSAPADATLRMPHPFPPVYAAPRPIRPRLLWIFLSWALFVVLVVAGVGGFAGGLFSTLGDAAPATIFSGGQSVNVALDPADKPAIYAAVDQPTDVRCQLGDGADPRVRLTRPAVSQTVTLNGTTWELMFEAGVPEAGTYQLACEGDGVRFGVGKQLTGAVGMLVGGAVALLALPTVGFLAALIVTIVVLARRSAARRRLA
ncbi:hypothetical protein [Microbispora catharanthi]|uniref:Serine/arginine repetitive matrix protein 2 n=1 Tax=Microbispora catharanthi TaxID=1712871 RepID=A0A5N6BI99_9ACTN|nr:hypothetical protein [Microbispora catharanthi]KAB8179928.1 hypothetical protein FH610_034655 [Microbispora catharanthi]